MNVFKPSARRKTFVAPFLSTRLNVPRSPRISNILPYGKETNYFHAEFLMKHFPIR